MRRAAIDCHKSDILWLQTQSLLTFSFTTFLQRNYVEISKGNEKLLKKKFACFDFLDTF